MSLQRGFPCQVSSSSPCHVPALSSLARTDVLEIDADLLTASPFGLNREPHDCTDFETLLLPCERRPSENDTSAKFHDCLGLLDISVSISATRSNRRSSFKQESEADSTPFYFPTSENRKCPTPPSIARPQPPNGSALTETLVRHDPETQCRYRNGKCAQPRTYKMNGALHTLCEWHRAKSCVNQKAFDSKKRRYSRKGVRQHKAPQSKSQLASKRSAKQPQGDAKPNKPSRGARRSRRLEASSLRRGDGDEDLFQAFTLVLDSNQLLQLQVPAFTQFLVCGSVVTAVHQFDEHALDSESVPPRHRI